MKWKVKDNTMKYGKFQKWHPWFAWHPIKFCDHWHWLERVLRRGTSSSWTFSFFDRLACVCEYEYKESILDLLKEGNTENHDTQEKRI